MSGSHLCRRGVARSAALAATALVLTAPPAAADPPEPSDYRSTVERIEPEVDGIDVEVAGGDSFLRLSVDAGHEVTVEGYQGEPYLRVLPDGTVERNRRSPATYVNDDRRGGARLPDDADADAVPDWEQVAGDGTYAWHDHRIHWMQSGRPAGVEPGEAVGDPYDPWTVALTVDGAPVAVQGRLVLAEEVSPLPWLAFALAAGGLVLVVGKRYPGFVAPTAALVAAAMAGIVAQQQAAAVPAGVGGSSPLMLGLPVAGAVAAVSGVVLWRRPAGAVATLAAVAAVAGWALVRLDVLWTAVLPTEAPFALDRAGTALSLGLALAAGALVILAGGLAHTTSPTPGGTGTPAVSRP